MTTCRRYRILAAALAGSLAACDRVPEPQAVAADRSPVTRPATTEPTAMADASQDKVTRTEEEWRKLLTPEQYRVLRQKGTERAFTGEYTDTTTPGTYSCAACDAELFKAEHKFHSGCGWPSFYTAAAGDRVTLTPDHSHGMTRTEVTCTRCGSHLGHVFNQETHTVNGKEAVVDRYCINSVALKFAPDKSPTSNPTDEPVKK